MSTKFISEPIEPDVSSFDTDRMATGEPGLPGRFFWRGNPVVIERVLISWRSTGPCRHGSKDRYVRRHWYEVLTDSGAILTIYFERSAHSRTPSPKRWWLFAEGRLKNGGQDEK